MNLIEKVTRDGATLANYSYLSDGTKISATNASGDGLVYIGSLVYRKRNGVLSLESAGFKGGRFVATNTGIEPRYFLTDHLGSTRVVVNNFGEVLERNDYHAYGKRWTDANSLLSDNRYGYNGKEKQDFVDLPYLDYGSRMADLFLGRWFNLDPLSEKYYSTSPFVFCAGNPVSNVDVDGRKIRNCSQYLQPHIQRIMIKTPTGKLQYDKLVNNRSDISVTRIDGYHPQNRTILGESSLRAVFKDPITNEIVGGKVDIVIYLRAVNDDAKANDMRVDDREAATLAEEIEHTDAKNIELQLEEREVEATTGREIPYEQKESEKEAHRFRDQVLKEFKIR